MSKVTQGRRVESLEELTEAGDYMLCDSENPDGTKRGFRELWFRLPEHPKPGVRHIHDGPDGWTFTENADGTVTVSPSIFAHIVQRDGSTKPGWHGFLEQGVWREC